MFGIVDASLIRPIPYADGDRLVIGRATFDPASVVGGIRSRLRGPNSNIPLREVTTMDAVVSESLSDHSTPLIPGLTL